MHRRQPLVIFGRDRAGGKVGIAAAMITFKAPPPGYDALWCMGVGAALSGRPSLRLAFYRLDRGHRSSQESPPTPPGVFTHHEHTTSRPRNSQIPN